MELAKQYLLDQGARGYCGLVSPVTPGPQWLLAYDCFLKGEPPERPSTPPLFYYSNEHKNKEPGPALLLKGGKLELGQ